MAKIAFIGEAWGADEEKFAHPFVGSAGQELYRMLSQVGFPCEHLPYNFVSPWSMTKRWAEFPYPLLNVFNCRPPDPAGKNNVDYFFAHPRDTDALDRSLPTRRVGQSKMYVLAEYASHVHALRESLRKDKHNLIIALGNTAMWALDLTPSIGKLRGSIFDTPYGKVIPVYHPAAILRNWSNRTVTLLDLLKARREMEYPGVKTTPRYIWTDPSISDLYEWWDTYGKSTPLLAVDIETLRKTQISEVGIAASPTQALHIPFVFESKSGNQKHYSNYWPTAADEAEAWRFVKMICESPNPKIGQNVLQYDTYWMLKEMGIRLLNVTQDTMTKSHAWQPELDKNLGFLASVFCDERSWKSIRKDVAKGED